jgi:hypothetical protein
MRSNQAEWARRNWVLGTLIQTTDGAIAIECDRPVICNLGKAYGKSKLSGGETLRE